MKLLFSSLFFTISFCFSQNYTSYVTGNATDFFGSAKGGTCLMGGAGEQDNAMRWFLQQANGGDILILRASGTDGYNSYLYSDLGITVNSVETIVFNTAQASTEPYVLDKIQKAEAIWFAGGDQWDYISYWRNTAISDLINEGITNRKIVVGGISAGMAILGGTYFTAENGTISSANALLNPFASTATLSNDVFLSVPFLSDVITDTHYDNPDRKGRQVVFMAKSQQIGNEIHGIACDEYVAVCIDTFGIAHVFGEYPAYNEKAYFLSVNCEVENNSPEILSANQALTWNKNAQAIKVYKAFGTITGTATFNLNNWEEGTEGIWENWSVNNGVLSEETEVIAPNCGLIVNELTEVSFINPTKKEDWITLPENVHHLKIFTAFGATIPYSLIESKMQIQHAKPGIYYLQYEQQNKLFFAKIIII